MTNHVHTIIGSDKNSLEDIVRYMKCHTSFELKKAIQQHAGESRKEWILWMMKRAGEKNSNNESFQLWQQHNQPVELSTIEMLHSLGVVIRVGEAVLYLAGDPSSLRLSR